MAQIASATAKQSKASAEVLQTVSNMNAATNQVTTAVREQAEGSQADPRRPWRTSTA